MKIVDKIDGIPGPGPETVAEFCGVLVSHFRWQHYLESDVKVAYEFKNTLKAEVAPKRSF